MTYTIVIPFPDVSLFPNRANGRHWSTRQNAAQAARTYAAFESLGRKIGDTCIDHSVRIIVGCMFNGVRRATNRARRKILLF